MINNKKVNLITILSLIFLSLFILFPAGALHSSSQVERTSEYLADVAANHTTSGKYAAMVVEPNDETEKQVNNAYTEFLLLYGLFREGLATYATVRNADKSHSVLLKEIEDGANYSFLNIDNGYGTVPYKDHYKHEWYPLEVMFYSDHKGVPGAVSFVFISQSKANLLLDKQGREHTEENYKSLLHSVITLDMDGKDYKFYIDNIYLENNYFYEALHEVMGDFFLGGTFYPKTFKRQAMFFLRDYAYQNKYYINHATSLYSENDFNYFILNRNFKDDFRINENNVVYFGNANGNVACILLTILSVLFLSGAILLIALGVYEFSVKNTLIVTLSTLLPYAVFWITYLVCKNVLFFSNFATNCEIWFILAFVISYIVIFLFKRKHKTKVMDSNL